MTNSIHPVFPDVLRGTVQLPASKSISARALIIGALAGDSHLENLSDCDDTRVLQQALRFRQPEINILAAGTAMRFSTAYFATCVGETHTITGTERMKQRPISVLVEALRQLGAHIDYMGQEGYPPVRVQGQRLEGGSVQLPANVSSQYISALLMIGPTMAKGLRLHLVGEIVSRPYIDMTIGLMKVFGADVSWISEQDLEVRPCPYRQGLHFDVEPDWSGASYWYEIMALTPDPQARIVLPKLRENSWQGDSIVEHLFAALGVHTDYEEDAAVLTKRNQPSAQSPIAWDFSAFPDLAQTLVVTCALLGRTFRFSGLQSLRIKETDRIAALQKELAKLGIEMTSEQRNEDGKQVEILQMSSPGTLLSAAAPVISTYEDHRMAMAFAPAAILCPRLRIEHPEVVSKSYPSFWEDLQRLQHGETMK